MNWNRKNLGGSGKWKLFVRCLKIVENSQKTKWKMDSRKLKISELLILNFKLVKINFLWIRLLNYSMMFLLRVYLFYSKIEYFQFYYSYNSIEFLFSRESHSHECLTFRFSDKVSFQSQKRLYNHKCPSVCSSVWLSVLKTPEQLEIIILHQSSFILHHSSFILHHLQSSFLHFATLKLFSLFWFHEKWWFWPLLRQSDPLEIDNFAPSFNHFTWYDMKNSYVKSRQTTLHLCLLWSQHYQSHGLKLALHD